MSLVKRRIGKHTYLYFKLPGPAEIYLGPEARPDHARLEEAIRYTRARVRHYENLLNELERLTGIHEEERRRLLNAIKPQIQTPLAPRIEAFELGSRSFVAVGKKKRKRTVKS